MRGHPPWTLAHALRRHTTLFYVANDTPDTPGPLYRSCRRGCFSARAHHRPPSSLGTLAMRQSRADGVVTLAVETLGHGCRSVTDTLPIICGHQCFARLPRKKKKTLTACRRAREWRGHLAHGHRGDTWWTRPALSLVEWLSRSLSVYHAPGPAGALPCSEIAPQTYT